MTGRGPEPGPVGRRAGRARRPRRRRPPARATGSGHRLGPPAPDLFAGHGDDAPVALRQPRSFTVRFAATFFAPVGVTSTTVRTVRPLRTTFRPVEESVTRIVPVFPGDSV